MEEVIETNDGVSSPLPATWQNSEPEAGASSGTSQNSNACTAKVAAAPQRSSSFQRWRRQMQRAWRSGPKTREQHNSTLSFNPEPLANQKRQWYRIHSKTMVRKQHKEPTSLFEQFFIVGLPADANTEAIEDALGRRKTWESEVAKSELLGLQSGGPSLRTLGPQILFQYPSKKRLGIPLSDIPAFCFPAGVKAQILERTPSMSDLNEVIYGQEHLRRDDLSFVFSLKVGSNATFYGVCLHVQEIVRRLPGFLRGTSPFSQLAGRSSPFLVAAPRCYCMLTRLPFFELHYEMLNSMIAQERLDRITQFANEMTLTESITLAVKTPDLATESSKSLEGPTESTKSSDISGSSVLNLTAVAADNEVQPAQSPESLSTSEVSDFSQTRETDKDIRKGLPYSEDYTSEATSGSRSDSFERADGTYENGYTSPDIGTLHSSVSHSLERIESSDSLLSSVRSLGSEDDDFDEVNSKYGDDEVIEWAKEHKSDLLQIVCRYHSMPLPTRGSDIIFQPLEHLQPIKYSRPGLSALGLDECLSRIEEDGSAIHTPEVYARFAASEEVLSLSIWTTATVCRALSLESVLALLTGVLLEKQVVVICPNLGILSAAVLSILPIIRPFEWQSLFLPILPKKMIDFLDAPVPFIVGIQQKPADARIKSSNLIRVNVRKDQVKMPSLPMLPRQRELVAELGPIHARLSCENSIARRHPVHKCSEVQAEAAGDFLKAMRSYLESLCSNLRTHTITSVQSNHDKVSLLLKDSFIDSFPTMDRPFIQLFVETQLFSVLSDFRLSRFEAE